MAKATSYGEVAIGLAFAAGGVGICVHASGLRDMPGSMAGPGLFPSLTGAGMMLFGVMLVASALLKARRSGPGGGGTSAAPADATASLALSGYSLAILAGVIALSATLPSLGFPAAATVFTAVVCRLGGAQLARRRHLRSGPDRHPLCRLCSWAGGAASPRGAERMRND